MTDATILAALAELEPSNWQPTPRLRWVPAYGKLTNAPGSWKLQQGWTSDIGTSEWRDVPHTVEEREK